MSLELIIVVPAHNEAKRLPTVLKEFVDLFGGSQINYKIIIVDNASIDGTAEVVGKLNLPEVLIIKEERLGKGRAVKTGFERALEFDSKYIGFVDADGSTPAKEYLRLFKVAQSFDGVIASRLLPGSQVYGRNILRQIISKSFRFFRGLLVPLPFLDTQCGAKIFKTEAIRQIIDDLTITDMAFDVQLLLLLYENKFFIREEPSIWVHTGASATTSSFSPLVRAGLKMFKSLLKIKKQ